MDILTEVSLPWTVHLQNPENNHTNYIQQHVLNVHRLYTAQSVFIQHDVQFIPDIYCNAKFVKYNIQQNQQKRFRWLSCLLIIIHNVGLNYRKTGAFFPA